MSEIEAQSPSFSQPSQPDKSCDTDEMRERRTRRPSELLGGRERYEYTNAENNFL